MIAGIAIKNLSKHNDQRGYLMEIIRADDDFFNGFGQFYAAENLAGEARDGQWHYHRGQDDYFCCVQGEIKVALYDRRRTSKTFGKLEFYVLSELKPRVLKIPRGVLHIYKTISSKPSLLINMTTRPYNTSKPDEFRLPIKKLVPDFKW